MTAEISFSKEIDNLMYASHGNPIRECLQCGTCSGTCPAVTFMDHSPRALIGMINSNLKEEVLESNTYWTCASCYHCTVRCPAGIDIADLMYALKRYTMWKGLHEELIGPAFAESFVKMIMSSGRSFEPILTVAYLPKFSATDVIREALMAPGLVFTGKMPLFPKKIKGLKGFQNMLKRIIPIGDKR